MDWPIPTFHPNDLVMIHHDNIVLEVLGVHLGRVSVTEASERASPSVESSDPVEAAAVEK